MTHRERFFNVVTHKKCDRVVLDLCGCPQTQIYDRRLITEEFLLKYDIDTRIVGGMPTPQTVHNRVENDIHYDSYGIGYKQLYGYSEICVNPLRDKDIDYIMAYPLPEVKDINVNIIKEWANKAEWLHTNTDYAVIAEHPVLGVFEIGCWMFGFDDYLYRLAAEPEVVHAFSERILEYQKGMIELYYGQLGKFIDCTTSGDDFGTQTGTFTSPDMFDDLVKPYFKERITYTKKFTDAFYQHHTCGSVHSLIPNLIDCGVDILNPIQPGTYMMEPERLKADYGDKMSFWGGIDTQHLLPEGNVDDVKNEVKRILKIMDCEGYILAPAHNIQKDVPFENLEAIYEGALEYYK
jgi:Uroporphyrinogen-III decarboxylase